MGFPWLSQAPLIFFCVLMFFFLCEHVLMYDGCLQHTSTVPSAPICIFSRDSHNPVHKSAVPILQMRDLRLREVNGHQRDRVGGLGPDSSCEASSLPYEEMLVFTVCQGLEVTLPGSLSKPGPF